MVGTDAALVEAELVGGLLGCSGCAGVLGPWGFARWRVSRRLDGVEERVRPRRGRCRVCRKTEVLLGVWGLIRRRDDVGTIGAALEAKAAGDGHGKIARALGRHKDTVRGWLRAFGRAAEAIRAHFTRWAHVLDAELGPIAPTGDGFADAVSAVGVAARAWVLRDGPTPAWRVAARLSGGALLCNTSRPFPPLP
jgi:hypothetical protein